MIMNSVLCFLLSFLSWNAWNFYSATGKGESKRLRILSFRFWFARTHSLSIMPGIINELCALFKSTRSTTVLWVTKKLIWIHAFRFRDAISDNVYLPPAYTTCCKDSLSPWLADNLVSMYHLVLFLLNLCHIDYTLMIHELDSSNWCVIHELSFSNWCVRYSSLYHCTVAL